MPRPVRYFSASVSPIDCAELNKRLGEVPANENVYSETPYETLLETARRVIKNHGTDKEHFAELYGVKVEDI